jgi:acyl-CoA thioesterase I
MRGSFGAQRSSLLQPSALVLFCLAFSIVANAQTLIVALGASNVSGRGVWPWQAWPAQLEGMLKAKGYNVHVKNAGKAGDTTSGMLHRLYLAIPSHTRIVILDMSGGFYNNSKHASRASQLRGPADMAAVEARLKSRGIIVIKYNERDLSIPPVDRQPDHIHLTVEGHRLLAKGLLPRVISALDSLGS